MKRFIFLILVLFSQLAYGQNGMFNTGDTLPDFSYQGQFAKPYHLKDLQGSYVLVLFWATWNDESRRFQLSLIDLYGKYKDRKFRKGRKFYIVSVSLDEEYNYWELSLKKDNLPWKNHVCDGLGWQSPVVKMSRIQGIPANYLLDPNGRIIGKNLFLADLEAILKDL